VGLRAGLDVIEKRKIFFPCRNQTPIPWSSTPELRHYTDRANLTPDGALVQIKRKEKETEIRRLKRSTAKEQRTLLRLVVLIIHT
jgi:hypothetical protein